MGYWQKTAVWGHGDIVGLTTLFPGKWTVRLLLALYDCRVQAGDKPQFPQSGEVAQLPRYRAAQPVFGKVQVFRHFKLRQFRRDGDGGGGNAQRIGDSARAVQPRPEFGHGPEVLLLKGRQPCRCKRLSHDLFREHHQRQRRRCRRPPKAPRAHPLTATPARIGRRNLSSNRLDPTCTIK